MPCFIDPGSIAAAEKYSQSIFWSKFNIFEIAALENEPGVAQIMAACSTTNPNAPNSNGWTPIHVAALHGHEEVVKVLAYFSAEDPNASNPEGWTPIQRAAYLGTVRSEGFLYKVALPELKISPIMYFVIHNSVVLSKILKIVVPF